jgi:hypothetical protein
LFPASVFDSEGLDTVLQPVFTHVAGRGRGAIVITKKLRYQSTTDNYFKLVISGKKTMPAI